MAYVFEILDGATGDVRGSLRVDTQNEEYAIEEAEGFATDLQIRVCRVVADGTQSITLSEVVTLIPIVIRCERRGRG
jgi:hypothetical protein